MGGTLGGINYKRRVSDWFCCTKWRDEVTM